MKARAWLWWVLWVALAVPAPAAEDARFVALSLDGLGWKRLDSYGPENPWSGVPQEWQKFGGVPFYLTAKVQFHGTGDARDNRYYPTHFKGLAVKSRAARLHILHGANMSDTNGRPIAALRVNYAGGGSHTMLVRYGVHTRDWWKHKDEKDASLSDTNSMMVWGGVSEDAEKVGATHRLFRTTFDLPARAEAVETLDAFSLFGKSAFILVGATFEAPGPETPAGRPEPSADLAKYRDELLMEVSGPGGAPVGNAKVKGSAIQRDNQRSTSTLLGRLDDTRNDAGLVTVDFPAETRALLVSVSAGAYGPKMVELKAEANGQMPRKASVQLPVGQRIRGTVLTPDGQPLAKAKVWVLGRATTSLATGEIEFDELTTDAQGGWKTQLAPDSARKLAFRVSHPDYSYTRINVTETAGENAITSREVFSGDAKLRITPKMQVTGTVKDESGQPVRRAHVVLAYENGSSSSSTDTRGRFTINTSSLREDVTLVVQHSNHAPFIAEMKLTGQPELVNVTLRSGEPFRGRVVEGVMPGSGMVPSPLAGASVTIRPTKGSMTLFSGTTDAEGRFVWKQAPPVPLRVEVRQANLMERIYTDLVGTNEFELSLWKSFATWGTVVDAETGKPVSAFTATAGWKTMEDKAYWRGNDAVQGRDGTFTLTERYRGSSFDQTVMKLEAPGYRPQLFSAKQVGWRSNRFELLPGAPGKGVVKLPDGKPAADAQVTVVGDEHMTLLGDKLANYTSMRGKSLIVTTDEAGRFEVPLRLAQRVVAVHEQGYGETTFSNLAAKGEIKLEPWGRIEGVARIGSKPATGSSIRLGESRFTDDLSYGMKALAVVDSEGKFAYDKVPPGRRWLTRLVQIRPSENMTAYYTPILVEPGKVTRAMIGGTGRPIIGRVVPDDPSRKIGWTNSTHSIYLAGPTTPTRTPEEARARREESRSYPILFAGDGSFRIEDVPAGSYRMNIYFYEPREAGSNFGSSAGVGSLNHEFEVEPMPGGRSDEPLDLGALELKTRREAVSIR